MRYKLLGRSGLRVSEICFGTMTFGEDWGWGADKDECKKMFKAFLDAGGNFVDTANRYTEGSSETIVGDLLGGIREQIVLATKYTLYMKQGDPNSGGNHRKNMVQALDNSLRRLKTDYIDLYWVHAWDFMTPVEEVMRGLDDLVRAGKILYVGVSDTPAWIVSRANMLAELRGWTPFVALQIEYSLLERTVERDLLPMARELDLAVTPWAVLGGGVLTGKYGSRAKEQPKTRRYPDDSDSARMQDWALKIGDEVAAVAEEIGCSPAHVAINWVRQQPGVVIPIIGARTEEQLRQNVEALKYPLNEAHLKRLDEISAVSMGFPHDFLSKDYIRNLVFAGTFDQIDNHRRR
jgi:aryl-alcohol dehydrogenase-like predicted oxidoreductase